MMKKQNLFLSLLFAASLGACINDAEVTGPDIPDPSPSPVVDGNISFRFVVPNSSASTRETAETSGNEEVGNANEYAVNNVRLYLFDNSTGNFYRSVEATNLTGPTVAGLSVTYESESMMLDPGTYRILAVANGNGTAISTPSTIDDFLGKTDAVTYAVGVIDNVPANGFVMTNRGGDSPVVTIATDTKTTASITLERVVAKVGLRLTQDTYNLYDEQGGMYASIKPANYSFINLSKEYYLFRHVATLADASATPAPITSWDINTHFGAIPDVNGYAIDPYFFEKQVPYDVTKFDPSAIFVNPLSKSAELVSTATFADAASGRYNYFYCLGNCAFRPAQLQAYTTGVLIRCSLTPDADHCFDESGNLFNPEDVSTLYYFNYNFYSSLAAVKSVGKANIPAGSNPTDAELEEYRIKRFNISQGSLSCYYNYWVKHLDNGLPTTLGVMEYAVVRNNMYRITITDIIGLGDGKPNTDPEPPVEKRGYLDVDYAVMPWIVRNNDVVLE